MSGAKKFVIKPFRPNVQMDDKQATKIWNALRSAIQEIHNKNASSLSFEELYRNAYNLVLHKHGEKLYVGLNDTWNDHHHTMVMIRDILMYMDRTYVVQKKKIPVYDRGLQIFLSQITRNTEVKSRLLKLLLDNIQRERNGEIIDRGLMKNTLSMFMHLGLKRRDMYVLFFFKFEIFFRTKFCT
eukprot:GSMAST32.ASY1.ANO1.2228.1 assembled CDS